MRQINEKPAKSMKCECKQKQICCKMQNDSLRSAIAILKENRNNSNTTLGTLESIDNLLDVYSCLPGTCLRKRVKWVYDHVEGDWYGELFEDERVKVNMLISELEAFLSNS